MPRNYLGRGFLVLAPLTFLTPSLSAQTQTNPHFVLTLGPTTLEGETTDGFPNGNAIFKHVVPGITIDPVGSVNPNGLPTMTFNYSGPSSASITVNVVSKGNYGAPVHFRIVQTLQGQAVSLVPQSFLSLTAFSTVSGTITVRSVLSISTQVLPNSDGPDIGSTGIVRAFSDGTSLATCTTTFSQFNGNTSPPCVLVPLDGTPVVLEFSLCVSRLRRQHAASQFIFCCS
jgi:hypothetical protein